MDMTLDDLSDLKVFKFSENKPVLLKNKCDTIKQMFHCDVCNIDLNSKLVYEDHLKGSKHLKRVSKLKAMETTNTQQNNIGLSEEYKCDICNLVLGSKLIYDHHIVGQKHIKKLKVKEKNDSLKCNICNVQSTNEEQFKLHLNGKKHLKKLKSTKQDDINTDLNAISGFKCDTCNLTLSNKDQLAIHLVGKKHLKKVNPSVNSKSIAKKNNDNQFDHLNIAWDKYLMKPEFKQQLKVKYDYYCELCKKCMEQKMQLVDHLKSKKHHRRIYEKRNNLKVNQQAGKRISFLKKNPPATLSTKLPTKIINFISTNIKNNEANLMNLNNNFLNTTVSNLDIKTEFELCSENVYSSVQPGQVQYFQPINQQNQMKRKYEENLNIEESNKHLKSNNSFQISNNNYQNNNQSDIINNYSSYDMFSNLTYS